MWLDIFVNTLQLPNNSPFLFLCAGRFGYLLAAQDNLIQDFSVNCFDSPMKFPALVK